MLVKEIVYMCLDAVKSFSDDSDITERHVIYLLKKYRNFLIKREQDKKKAFTDSISESEYQQICLDLEEAKVIDGEPCTQEFLMKSVQRIPDTIDGIPQRIYPINYFQNIYFCFTSKERMRYVGVNKYMQNIIYACIGPDDYLYLTSGNPQILNLEGIRFGAVFDDFEEANDLTCDDDACSAVCDVMEMEFPLRSHLVSPLIELVVNNLRQIEQVPEDKDNDAQDNASPKAADKTTK